MDLAFTRSAFGLSSSAYNCCLSLLLTSTRISDQDSAFCFGTLLSARFQALLVPNSNTVYNLVPSICSAVTGAGLWLKSDHNWTWCIRSVPPAAALLIQYFQVPFFIVCTLSLVPYHHPCRPCLVLQGVLDRNCSRDYPHHQFHSLPSQKSDKAIHVTSNSVDWMQLE